MVNPHEFFDYFAKYLRVTFIFLLFSNTSRLKSPSRLILFDTLFGKRTVRFTLPIVNETIPIKVELKSGIPLEFETDLNIFLYSIIDA
jgi:hypothetical protein